MAEWTPRVRRINTSDVGEQGKLTFISSLIGERRYDEAEDELKSLLEANPRSYLANLQMGRLSQRKREFDRAAEFFETARMANPTSSQAPLLAGGAYLRSADFDRAGASFQTALEIEPKLATAHAGLAQVHFRRNDLKAAEASLEEALALDPEMRRARTLMARIHSKRGDVEASKREVEDIISTRPDQPRPIVGLARLHLQANEPKEAIAVLEQGVSQHESSVELWAMLGRARLAAEDYAGAEQALRKALDLDPRERMVGLKLLQALIPQGKLQEAMQLLHGVPERARRNPLVHAAYGDIHMAAGRYKQAAESYRAAMLRRADGKSVVDSIVLPTSSEGDWKVAAERLQVALHDLRKDAANEDDDEEGGDARRPRALRRRQAARAAA
jgi:predicted Zn-dependent protease